MTFRTLAFLLVWLTAALSPEVGAAKIVAIVYDDSGSMRGGENLPAFAATTLMATLEAGQGGERLLVMSFRDFFEAAITLPELSRAPRGDAEAVSQSVIENIPFTVERTPGHIDRMARPPYRTAPLSVAGHQRLVDGYARDFTTLYYGTPYGSIDAMLEAIVRESQPEEEVQLVIITDGDFSGIEAVGEGYTAMSRNMAAYRSRIAGNVSVSYVQILPGPNILNAEGNPARPALIRQVQTQGVRDALLAVFNGSTDAGTYEVGNAEQLWGALRQIIAQINATDRAALGHYVRSRGSEIEIETPFAITRIISVATGARGTPPSVQSTSFDAETYTLETAMEREDRNYPGFRFQGATTQFLFRAPLPKGTHRVVYDRAVGDQVFLLFDTSVGMVFDILDGAGAPLTPGADGTYELDQGEPYTITATLIDEATQEMVDFTDLAEGSQFLGEIDGEAGVEALALSRNDPEDRAEAAYVPSRTGEFALRGETLLPGFVSPKAEALRFLVVSRAVGLSLSGDASAEACEACAGDEYQSTVRRGDAYVPVATLDVTASAEQPGRVTVSPEGTTGALTILGPDGLPLTGPKEFDVPAGQSSLRFEVIRPGVLDTETLSESRTLDLTLSITPSGPSNGEPLVIERRVRPFVEEATLTLVAQDRGSAGTEPLVISGRELVEGSVGATFRLSGHVIEDPGLGNFTTALVGPGMTRVRTAPSAFTDPDLRLAPDTRFWCLCWIGLYSTLTGPERTIEVAYADPAGLQSATAPLQITIEIAGRTFLLSCLLNLLHLVLALWFLWSMLAILRANRFPRNSIAVERVPGEEFKKQYELRGHNWTFPRAFLSPFVGPPHETATIAGMRLQATSDGAQILLDCNATPPWYVELRGMTIRELRQFDPDLQRLDWPWGSGLRDERQKGRTLTLIRDASQGF